MAPPEAAPVLRVAGVSKVFGHGTAAVSALDGLELEVSRGQFVCLVGASGCGKSTLLHLLAGLDTPTSGTLRVEGRTALMFQEAALFPWLTVAGNVALALRLRGVPRRERPGLVHSLLEMVHLQGFATRRPHELSGGMRQRVALARALAQDADVLLMDEPFGSLDAMTRDLLHAELERLWSDRRFTVLFVTHNVREAVRLADRVLVLTSRPGRVAACIDVEIPRPRRIETPAVSALAGEITEQLAREVQRHGHA
ncbi:MAG: ABC transporter ATP-binding protein [Acidimicrobiia bacterium]|nr:ABC transporter ATP-binding protein [Acidimicrobiia bacterium]